jgi:hypothetical protein
LSERPYWLHQRSGCLSIWPLPLHCIWWLSCSGTATTTRLLGFHIIINFVWKWGWHPEIFFFSCQVWNLENLLPIQSLSRHEGSVNALVLHGDLLFTGSDDSEIKVGHFLVHILRHALEFLLSVLNLMWKQFQYFFRVIACASDYILLCSSRRYIDISRWTWDLLLNEGQSASAGNYFVSVCFRLLQCFSCLFAMLCGIYSKLGKSQIF